MTLFYKVFKKSWWDTLQNTVFFFFCVCYKYLGDETNLIQSLIINVLHKCVLVGTEYG